MAKVWPGNNYPLGAFYDGAGTNFSIFSEIADRVELCLFDEGGTETKYDLPEVTSFCWHGYLPKVGPGQRYGFRVHGPWKPEEGHRCNPAKLLLDPYARAIEGQARWNEALFSYSFDNPDGPSNDIDSAPSMPKCVVTTPYFDWGNDRIRVPNGMRRLSTKCMSKVFRSTIPIYPVSCAGLMAAWAIRRPLNISLAWASPP
jgi:isoamylase